ncbi:hypothetical protein, variant 1 [Aphanomyces invadans]|uniref:protein-tyrosine-phosphatase n=1 Tax=Aphanomyces invadans TaxID=157072 RepID=A0A024U538_9STRA|nr:hypothetical protein, variant 1 [Aphanomyces invadans]ETW01359.1 hypothetical protein, variant 1 [Aphanomyces invadans]|eukprot:XP_008870357.1 hypothetical protein, variant 1 [Aphanomyces invadans]
MLSTHEERVEEGALADDSERADVSRQNAKKPMKGAFRKFWQGMLTQKYLQHDNQPAQVLPGLFVGSVGAGANLDALCALSITHILVASETVAFTFESHGRFEYYRVSIRDVSSARISYFFEESNAFITGGLKDGGKVLVHCFAGQSRSVTLVMGRHMSFEAALELVRQVRPQARPNHGFAVQLKAYARQHAAAIPHDCV